MIEIRVPATTANLGPGFDCLGAALQIFDTFTAEESISDELLNIASQYNNADNLFLKAFHSISNRHVRVRFDADIPSARGLGSSAALSAAGVTAALAVENRPLNADFIFEKTSELEGHPDNAAPAVYGGLTASLKEGEGIYMTRPLSLHPSWCFTVFIPDFEVKTADARAVLPETYPRSVIGSALGHAIWMSEGLRNGDMTALKAAANDVIHEPYRKKLIAGFDEQKKTVEKDTGGKLLISGSGSTCLLISQRPLSAAGMQEVREQPVHWDIRKTAIDPHGLAIKENGLWRPII